MVLLPSFHACFETFLGVRFAIFLEVLILHKSPKKLLNPARPVRREACCPAHRIDSTSFSFRRSKKFFPLAYRRVPENQPLMCQHLFAQTNRATILLLHRLCQYQVPGSLENMSHTNAVDLIQPGQSKTATAR